MLGKVTEIVARTLVAIRKKKKNSKSKTATLMCFDNLRKKQQDHGSKNDHTESFMSLTTSNIRTTAFCFENTELLK